MRSLHKARESGNYGPRDQDACYPYTSSDFVKDEVAGDLEQKVTPEKDSGCESELLAGDGQFAIHRQRCKSDVDAVEESNDIEHEEKRQQPDSEFPDRHSLDGIRNSTRGICHLSCFPTELVKSGRSLKKSPDMTMAST